MNKVLLFLFLTVFCFTKSLLAVVPTISVQTNSGTLNFCTANTLALSVVNTTNGGTMPMYQWYKNGVAITGATLSTFTSIGNLISVNDQFYCELTSNDPTASPTVVNSNVIALNVTLVVTPTIAITSIPVSGVACAGQLVTFVAPISYGGTTPVRQWKKMV